MQKAPNYNSVGRSKSLRSFLHALLRRVGSGVQQERNFKNVGPKRSVVHGHMVIIDFMAPVVSLERLKTVDDHARFINR